MDTLLNFWKSDLFKIFTENKRNAKNTTDNVELKQYYLGRASLAEELMNKNKHKKQFL